MENGVDLSKSKYSNSIIILKRYRLLDQAFGDIADSAQAMKNGAFDYNVKGKMIICASFRFANKGHGKK